MGKLISLKEYKKERCLDWVKSAHELQIKLNEIDEQYQDKRKFDESVLSIVFPVFIIIMALLFIWGSLR